ncbi:hypothetical protein K438DRAFT_1572215 [Mycena galopus ATCC 62051]|nr:hypothetical protein K438DRAFT_1572215 [Mycena galopus ATCC 62051]
MATHIIEQGDTQEVEEFLFRTGERSSLSPKKETGRQENKRTVFLKKSKVVQQRPPRNKSDNFCLTAYVEVNGQKAFTLFDSGCTTDTISPDFARVANLTVLPIETAITLQLGTAGSRSMINYGTKSKVGYGTIVSEEYMDIVNLDRFDMITYSIGTIFMRKHKVSLDFESNTIKIAGLSAPTLSAMEEKAEVERRNAARHHEKSE